MRRPVQLGPVRPPEANKRSHPGSRRNRLAVLLAIVTAVGLGSAFFLSKGTLLLMPGPLTSAHGAIEKCSACHTKSGSGKLSWVHGLVAGDSLADSKACLTCHKMPDTAFNAHGASAGALQESTERLSKRAAASHQPLSARAQDIAFPTHAVVARDLYCATCHQEHQGADFELNRISNEQCRSCHVVKFDSFDGHHPQFDNYPFDRRTRIIYDHAGHFGKHYPELAKREPSRRIPDTCSSCHNSNKDRRVMAVAPFDQACASCHLDQIIGKERASGPKGIAFLTLPGLDRETLKTKNAPIGEWPDASEAALTPFMQVMLSRDEPGRILIKTVAALNLQDLSDASDDQIKAVTDLVWAIKGLFHALIKGKASEVLGDLDIGGGAKLSAPLIADLTASIPRDVVVSAQQQWLPNLATEMAKRGGDQEPEGWSAATTEPGSDGSASPEGSSGSDDPEQGATSAAPTEESLAGPESSVAPSEADATQAAPTDSPQDEGGQAPRKAKLDPLPCTVSVLGQCLLFSEPSDKAKSAEPRGATGESDAAIARFVGDGETPSPKELPPAMRAGVADVASEARHAGVAGKRIAASATPEPAKEAANVDAQPRARAADQTDDLLFPTEKELREIKARKKDAGQAAEPEAAAANPDAANAEADGAASGDAATEADAAAGPQTTAASVLDIETDVDPESWADYGGWYRQDYTIFYRPVGHKDKFIYSWLSLAGLPAPKGDASPAAAVFDHLTSKDAQGACTKCHSVDEIQGKGRLVNFSPLEAEAKQGRFTSFVHEPHFAILDDRGCLTCHELVKGNPEEASGVSDTAAANKDAEWARNPYLKSYEQGNPHSFSLGFGLVEKGVCQNCHTSGMARQDCLLCHKYHVNGVISPVVETKIPDQ